jgi:integrase
VIPAKRYSHEVRIVLTDKAIKALKARGSLYRVADAMGLCIEVRPDGSRYWRFRYRFAGKGKLLSLGVYPAVSLKDARKRRDAARETVADGRDPSAERQMEKSRAKIAVDNTFESIAREWLAVKANEWVLSQQEKERRRLEKHAFPWIGKKPIAVIGTAEIRPLLDRLVKRDTLDMAHRLRQQMSAVFRFAVATDRASRDPAADLSGTLPVHTQRNYSTITNPVDVGELLRAIDGFHGGFSTACALRLAPLLFTRPGELRAAEWSEVDMGGAEWRIPAARRKLRRKLKENASTPPQIVPLCSQAVAILHELHPLTGHGRYLFPGVRDARRPMSDATINAALRRLGYNKETMTAHGFRHMASTRLHELGWNPDAIERQLGHKAQGIRSVYNKAEHMAERRKMMQSWADYLDGLRIGADIVPIRRRA